MKTFGNIVWLLLIGVVLGITWALIGVAMCITLIGIPFGLQCFKFSRLAFWPFGAEVDKDFERHPVGNFIWIVLFGLAFTISFGVLGIAFCVTIIGIPFGKQCFKMSKLIFMPFGAEIYTENDIVIE